MLGEKALAGVKVVDLTTALSGPFGTMFFADYGAEVIKVVPVNGDQSRKWGPFEEKSKEYARGLLTTQNHPKVLQAIASFFWIYEEPFVWDIFIEVLKKKRDKLTLSHIGIAIRQCYRLSQEHNRADYISDSQLKELVEVLESKEILPRETELLKSL